ncbi:MAG: transcriptional regulator (plasmid) [Candidatus Symbiodolus clandestinus]
MCNLARSGRWTANGHQHRKVRSRTKDDYERAVFVLNQLLDVGAADERHPLADLANTLGVLISEYDDAHYPVQSVPPSNMLKCLMEQHRLIQSSLPEVGSQGVVSDILSGKRKLNLRQIKALSERFKVSPSVFI